MTKNKKKTPPKASSACPAVSRVPLLSMQDIEQLRTNVEWEMFAEHHRRRKRTHDGFEGSTGDDRDEGAMWGGEGAGGGCDGGGNDEETDARRYPLRDETDIWVYSTRMMRAATELFVGGPVTRTRSKAKTKTKTKTKTNPAEISSSVSVTPNDAGILAAASRTTPDPVVSVTSVPESSPPGGEQHIPCSDPGALRSAPGADPGALRSAPGADPGALRSAPLRSAPGADPGALRSAPGVCTGTPDGSLRVSTKTQSLKLDGGRWPVSVPFLDIFWRVSVIPYMQPREGVVKKELRVEMKSDAEVAEYETRKRAQELAAPTIAVTENLYRRKYLRGELKADVRRLNVGICQKELQCKKRTHKLAFSNCFVVYLRWTTNGGESFDESHVKVFSTGQIDLPGISDPARLHHLHCLLHKVLLVDTGAVPPASPPRWVAAPHAVLINSDFLCNFQLDREKLRELLLQQYGIKSMSQIEQPGLRCPIYVRRAAVERGDISADSLVLEPEHEKILQNAKGKRGKLDVKSLMAEFYFKITCTFFRTGKVLISGACTPVALELVFRRMRDILLQHHAEIRTHGASLAVKKAKKTHYVSKSKHMFDLDYYATKVLGGAPPYAREFPSFLS